MRDDKGHTVFFELLRAGLWEKAVQLHYYGEIDFDDVFRLADEQSVVGLVAAGIEHVVDTKPQKKNVVPFIGRTVHLEKRNAAMNGFIAVLTDKLREEGIQSVLVKGQGVAQCYERPLWRASGDIDLLFDSENYERAKAFLIPQATSVKEEFSYLKHLGMHLGDWELELQGHFRSRLSKRIDKELDQLFDNCLNGGEVRVWRNGAADVLLPAPDIDVLFSFTHLLRHFFLEGVGLRQICDWCRLLWTYRATLDRELLGNRLRRMKLMSEWKAFGSFAVEWLGMPAEEMPLYDAGARWSRKAGRIGEFVLKVGNFGHNQVCRSSRKSYPYMVRKFLSFGERFGSVIRHFPIFPRDSICFFWQVMVSGVEMSVNKTKR